VSQRQISCPVLLDPDARISQRFNIENVPAFVIVDAQGNLRRRLVGSRTETVLEALMQEVSQRQEGGK
jgi:predicted DsbA family dithiol-disulfide isomerase